LINRNENKLTLKNKKMKKISIQIAAIIVLLNACSPATQLTKTWTDPSVTAGGFEPFKKVLVLASLKDVTGNRIAEDKLAAQFTKGNAVPSYSYLQSSDTVQSLVDAKLKQDGFDGLVTMRLADVDKSLYVQGGAYGYGGYYGGRYGYGHSGATVSVDHSYIVETCIYSLASGKLLWSGTTSTLNPDNLERAIDDIIAADKAQLVKQGLMKSEVR
jgi:hypothetical protein